MAWSAAFFKTKTQGKYSLKRAKENAKKSWNDAHLSHAERTAKMLEEQSEQIEQANARKAAAEERIAKAKAERK